ncbi:hypothetical protein SELMODRAFT_114779 [Selaginella moellendorffii]|uniref:Importin N-terminal domain-containing protein n=1 Tax=Selaginella moellendorffii TaxID=88036 RepID=D8SDS8_SELML|nr:hypothetical protein SELMODRAFT_114779 [Selaginella moellendorffii]
MKPLRTMVALSQAFVRISSPSLGPDLEAEFYISNASNQPGYGIALLQLLGEATAITQDDTYCQALASSFKNHVKTRWNPSDEITLAIQDSEKEQIKSLVVRLMLASPPRIQSFLRQAVAIISSYDFPNNWKGLLPELVMRLSSSTTYASIHAILRAVNSIFQKFGHESKSPELYSDLKYCLDGFAAPLLEVFTKIGAVIKATTPVDAATLETLLECQKQCCQIFYSLNSQELPEFFEDHIKEWMGEFEYYLSYANPALTSCETGIVDQVKTAVCDNINLYMEKNEEEFRDFLPGLATSVGSLLMSTSLQPAQDQLAMAAVKFLTTVSKSVHHGLFSGADTLRQICERIVIPNVRIREEDEALFRDNPWEYIQKDIEGSDMDTRRRVSSELIKGLMLHYREPVKSLMAELLQRLCSVSSGSKDKDTAIYLIVALAQRQSSFTVGATTDLVNVEQFLASQIIPALQGNELLLQASALKFVTSFRSAASKAVALGLMPQIIKLLLSDSVVVCSYAAWCVDRLLLVRDGGAPRFSSADLAPFQDQLLANSLSGLQRLGSQDNPYVMKCIMRVLSLAEDQAGMRHLDGLMEIVIRARDNPANPAFNHYVFESVSVLVRKACHHRDLDVVMAFEERLFPVFQSILQNNVAEFQPYVFQVLAQLVESRAQPIPGVYLQLFPMLLAQLSQQSSGSTPAMIRLLEAFLLKAPREIAQANQLQEVCNLVHALVLRRSTEDYAFYIANAVVESLGQEQLMPAIDRSLWTSFFSRAMGGQRTVKFLKLLTLFMALFTVKHGPGGLVDSINRLQPGLFTNVLEQLWIPALSYISGRIETKLCAVASARLLCESQVLVGDQILWRKLLDGVETLMARPDEEQGQVEEDVPEMDIVSGYCGGGYAQLHNSGRKEEDPLKDVKDAREYVRASLQMKYPGL